MISIVDENVDVSPDAVRQIIGATRPTQVRVDEIHCGPVEVSDSDTIRYQLKRSEPSFAFANDGQAILVRLPHELQCLSGDSDEGGTDIRIVHVAVFSVLNEIETSIEALSAWIETNVYFLVYPYVRQLMTTLTGELGLPPVLLDYMHRDELPYSQTEATQSPEQ